VGCEPGEGERPFLTRRLQDSGGLRARVAAARALGISSKRFDGWEPKQVTEYEYDEATGRLLRSVTTVEAEWDDDEQALMLALAEYEALTCGGCGGWLPETTALENSDNYAPPKPVRCHGCEAMSIAHEHRGDKKRPGAQRWPSPKRKKRR